MIASLVLHWSSCAHFELYGMFILSFLLFFYHPVFCFFRFRSRVLLKHRQVDGPNSIIFRVSYCGFHQSTSLLQSWCFPFQPLNSWFHTTHRHGLWIRYVHMLAMNGQKLSLKIYMGASELTSYMLVPGRLHVAHQMEVETDVISCNVASRPFARAGGARWWALQFIYIYMHTWIYKCIIFIIIIIMYCHDMYW